MPKLRGRYKKYLFNSNEQISRQTRFCQQQTAKNKSTNHMESEQRQSQVTVGLHLNNQSTAVQLNANQEDENRVSYRSLSLTVFKSAKPIETIRRIKNPENIAEPTRQNLKNLQQFLADPKAKAKFLKTAKILYLSCDLFIVFMQLTTT
jgi:hypothetical protein